MSPAANSPDNPIPAVAPPNPPAAPSQNPPTGTPDPAPPDTSAHIPALDGLRGAAVLLVLVWHYLAFTQPFFPSWAGVDLFFVLSGYLITGRLLATKGGPHYFSGFYRNRILRIFPLYYAVILAFYLFARLLVREANQPQYAWYFEHWKSFLVFIQNWTLIYDGRPRTIELVPLWSLAVEEQFYLVWPLIIFLIPSPSLRIKLFSIGIGLVLLARTACYLSDPLSAEPAYFNTFLHLDGLLTGSLLCQLHAANIRLPKRWISALVAASLMAITLYCTITKSVVPHNPFFATAGYTVLAILFAAVLHLAAQPGKTLLNTFLSTRLLRSCGRISYCLYLIHLPILIVIGTKLSAILAKRWPGHALLASWLALLICLALSFVLSMLSYRYFESRFLRFKTRQAGPVQKNP